MIEELTELAQFMKDHRILHVKVRDPLKASEVELTMHPDGFPGGKLPEPDPKDKEVGATGLSREQIRDLFNQVFEDDFQKPR